MTAEPAPCDPTWPDPPDEMQRLYEIGAREFHGHTATQGRDITTIQPTGEYL